MSEQIFVDRVEEISILENKYKKDNAEFIVIYGRRRIGKSELIKHFLKGKNGVYFLAREESEKNQLKILSQKLSEFFKDEVLKKNPFSSWDAVFEYLAEKSSNRIIIALDEFPNLVAENHSLPSIFQDYWENKLKKTKIFIIVCGSSISMMEKEIFSHKSPLYGRRTAQLLLKPFNFRSVFNYLNKNLGKSFEEAVEFYAVFGGTPQYVMSINNKSIFDNIENILKPDSILFNDVEFLLRDELRKPRYYFSVLHSVAKGNTKLSDVINDTGLKRELVAKYLSVLSDLQFIKREVPVTENKLKSRKGVYVISDDFFRFWFRYVYPRKDEIQLDKSEVESEIKNSFAQYVSKTFEDVCKEALVILKERKQVLDFEKKGRWWYGDKEIDIVAFNEKNIVFAECKWKNNVDVKKVFEELKEKSKYLPQNKIKKYIIFAKSFKDKIEEEDLFLFDLKDLEALFKS